MAKVFLGGTCSGHNWRGDLIPLLKVDYFNPVVKNWNEECYQEELRQREICDYLLYVITKGMKGVYSIAEVIDDSNKKPKKTIFCVLEDGFSKGELKSLKAVGRMVERNGGVYLGDLDVVADYINGLEEF